MPRVRPSLNDDTAARRAMPGLLAVALRARSWAENRGWLALTRLDGPAPAGERSQSARTTRSSLAATATGRIIEFHPRAPCGRVRMKSIT